MLYSDITHRSGHWWHHAYGDITHWCRCYPPSQEVFFYIKYFLSKCHKNSEVPKPKHSDCKNYLDFRVPNIQGLHDNFCGCKSFFELISPLWKFMFHWFKRILWLVCIQELPFIRGSSHGNRNDSHLIFWWT